SRSPFARSAPTCARPLLWAGTARGADLSGTDGCRMPRRRAREGHARRSPSARPLLRQTRAHRANLAALCRTLRPARTPCSSNRVHSFDVLHLNGCSTMPLPNEERRQLLASLERSDPDVADAVLPGRRRRRVARGERAHGPRGLGGQTTRESVRARCALVEL